MAVVAVVLLWSMAGCCSAVLWREPRQRASQACSRRGGPQGAVLARRAPDHSSSYSFSSFPYSPTYPNTHLATLVLHFPPLATVPSSASSCLGHMHHYLTVFQFRVALVPLLTSSSPWPISPRGVLTKNTHNPVKQIRAVLLKPPLMMIIFGYKIIGQVGKACSN